MERSRMLITETRWGISSVLWHCWLGNMEGIWPVKDHACYPQKATYWIIWRSGVTVS